MTSTIFLIFSIKRAFNQKCSNSFKTYINLQKMSDFPIEKADLISIVSLCQERRYAEEVQELQKFGNNTSWLVQGLKTDLKKGIETTESQVLERKNKYGTN